MSNLLVLSAVSLIVLNKTCITMSHAFKGKTVCLDFSRTTSNSSHHLSTSLPSFHTYLTGPLSNSYKFYELKCNGGKMNFCGYEERIGRACPTVNLNGRRTVTGVMKLCGISYTLSSCQFTGRANQTEEFKSSGDIQGFTHSVEIKFVIVSTGLRYFCRLHKPRLLKNFAFFPAKFFETESKMVDGLNKLNLREAIMGAINGLLSANIASLLGKKNDCTDFFRISRH